MARTLPSGYSLSYWNLTPDDCAGWALIASLIGLLFMLTFGLATVSYRRMHALPGRYVDVLILNSLMFATIQSVLVIAAASRSVGKSTLLLDTGVQTATEKILYASDLFYLSTICSTRLVVLSFQYSLFGRVPQHAILIGCGAIGSALSMVMGVIMIGLGCHGIPSWLQCSEACDSLDTRWNVIVAVGIGTELYLIIILLISLRPVQMSKKKKLAAFGPFATRLSIVVISTIRLIELHELRSSPEPMFDRVAIVGLTQAEQAFSLLTAVIPMIQHLINEFNTRVHSIDQTEQSRRDGTHVVSKVRPKPSRSSFGSEAQIIHVTEEYTVTSGTL